MITPVHTIIDLPAEQVEALAQLCEKTGISQEEAIRRAVDKLLQEEAASSREESLRATFGAWKGRDLDGRQYVEKLRAEWD